MFKSQNSAWAGVIIAVGLVGCGEARRTPHWTTMSPAEIETRIRDEFESKTESIREDLGITDRDRIAALSKSFRLDSQVFRHCTSCLRPRRLSLSDSSLFFSDDGKVFFLNDREEIVGHALLPDAFCHHLGLGTSGLFVWEENLASHDGQPLRRWSVIAEQEFERSFRTLLSTAGSVELIPAQMEAGLEPGEKPPLAKAISGRRTLQLLAEAFEVDGESKRMLVGLRPVVVIKLNGETFVARDRLLVVLCNGVDVLGIPMTEHFFPLICKAAGLQWQDEPARSLPSPWMDLSEKQIEKEIVDAISGADKMELQFHRIGSNRQKDVQKTRTITDRAILDRIADRVRCTSNKRIGQMNSGFLLDISTPSGDYSLAPYGAIRPCAKGAQGEVSAKHLHVWVDDELWNSLRDCLGIPVYFDLEPPGRPQSKQ